MPWQVGLGVLAVAVAAVVSLARQPGVGALDTVWAEDGEIFLADAVNKSFLEALSTSYAGYFHLGPRLLAELAAVAPASWAAAVLAIGAAVVTGALAVLVYVASAGHLRSWVARTAAAAIVVVVPVAQHDVPNSIANLHWPALYALFWVLLWTPPGWPGRLVAVSAVALVATSDILVVALLPLALVRLAVRRDRHSTVLASVLTAGVAIQLLGLVTGASSRETDLDPVRAASGYVLRAVPGALVGSRWLGPDHVSLRWFGLAALAWLLLLAAVLFAWRRVARPGWMLAVAAGLCGLGLYTLPVFLSGVATERYAVAPAMLLVVALLALLPPEATRAGLVVVGLLAIVCLVNLRVPNLRAEGPSWSDEVAQARLACAVTGTGAVSVPLPPAPPPDWYAELPCGYLSR